MTCMRMATEHGLVEHGHGHRAQCGTVHVQEQGAGGAESL